MCTFNNSHTKESKDWLLRIGEAASLSRTSLIPRRYPIIPSDTFLGGWCIWEMTALCMSETQNALVGDRACPDTSQETTDSPNGTCGRLLVNHLSVALWSCSAGYTPCKSPQTLNEYILQWVACCILNGGRGAAVAKIVRNPWMEPTCVACAMITCTVNTFFWFDRMGASAQSRRNIAPCILCSFAEHSSNLKERCSYVLFIHLNMDCAVTESDNCLLTCTLIPQRCEETKKISVPPIICVAVNNCMHIWMFSMLNHWSVIWNNKEHFTADVTLQLRIVG